jgi:hypothetical protein
MHEDVKGSANGVTEVRATSELLPDGKFHVKAEYLRMESGPRAMRSRTGKRRGRSWVFR